MSTWKHDDVLPVIDRIIDEELSKLSFVTVREVAPRLLQESFTKRIIAEVVDASRGEKQPKRVAANMFAWFSQRITMETYPCRWPRKRVRGRWNYLRSPNPS